MKKTMTPEQLAANRCNAGKSTGPKTMAGKAVSRMNGRKYGQLARQIVICGHHYRESPHELKRLCRKYY
jgi:hypothetical protein